MTRKGHHLTGIGAAMLAAAGAIQADLPVVVAAVAALPGATAPDWLEVPGWILGRRFSLIPHRTWTHWGVFWAVLLALAFLPSVPEPARAGLLGFSLGGLMHLLHDWPNPMGVPWIVPWKRHSLRWWRSGEYELLSILATWGVCALPLWAVLP